MIIFKWAYCIVFFIGGLILFVIGSTFHWQKAIKVSINIRDYVNRILS